MKAGSPHISSLSFSDSLTQLESTGGPLCEAIVRSITERVQILCSKSDAHVESRSLPDHLLKMHCSSHVLAARFPSSNPYRIERGDTLLEEDFIT